MNGLKIIAVVALAVAFAACTRERAPAPPAAPSLGEDEFAARAAALGKTCELAAVYLGTDNRRAGALAAQGRDDALDAVRRAPDSFRGVVFARVYERLDAAALTLRGAGDYAPALTASEYERLRADLLLCADDLRPLGEPYYLKLARKYEPPRRPGVVWGPLPPSAAKPARPPAAAPAETAGAPPPAAGTAGAAGP